MITLPERVLPDSEHFHKMLDAHGVDIRVAAPGTIHSFDAVKGTAVVQLTIREKQNINGVMQDVPVPLLPDVPVVMPRAGGYLLTLPIAVGDEVLVIFSDNCIDGWWQSGGVQNQMDNRRHDLSDCFAIPGPWSQARKISGYSTSSAQLRDEAGDTYIDLQSGQITIHADTLNFTGSNININGGGNTVIESRNFLDHEHKDVQIGSGNSGGVV